MTNFQRAKYVFFSFKGRIGRQTYWLSVLGYMLLVLGYAAIAGTIAYPLALLNIEEVKSIFYVIFVGGGAILMLWSTLAIWIKRLHDRNKSAWWILIYLLPIIGPVYLTIQICFLKGTEGPNRFGEDPLVK